MPANYFKFDSRSAIVPNSATASASFSVLAVCHSFMKQTLLQVFSVEFAQNTEETLQAGLLFTVSTRILSRQVVVFIMRNRQVAHRLVMLLSNRSGKPLPVVLKNQRGVKLWRLEFHKRQFGECYGGRLHLKPYRLMMLQHITDLDKAARGEFCAVMLDRIREDETFLNLIILSDESSFHFSGKVLITAEYGGTKTQKNRLNEFGTVQK
ncbi:hypothetical protein J6590_074012 [Homalodisca vitripennis]|nr:hypothetical protein J6590_074012 [Homalodisca vitripennis]